MTRKTDHQSQIVRPVWFSILRSCLFCLIGIPLALFIAYSYQRNIDEQKFKQSVIRQFKEVDPNAKIRIDVHDYGNYGLDIVSGSEIVLFHSDAATMKAVIKKWKFRGYGNFGRNAMSGIDKFHTWAWPDAAQRDLRELQRGSSTWFSSEGNQPFNPDLFSSLDLIWDEETGSGCFYCEWRH